MKHAIIHKSFVRVDVLRRSVASCDILRRLAVFRQTPELLSWYTCILIRGAILLVIKSASTPEEEELQTEEY